TQPQAYVYMDYQHVGRAKFFPAKMPYINKKPIGLSNNEILAVIAFLQSMSGEEITVDLSEIEAPRDVVVVMGDKAAGQKVFQSLCAKCHSIGGTRGNLVPVLNKQSDAAIRRAILTEPKTGSKDHQSLGRLPVKESGARPRSRGRQYSSCSHSSSAAKPRAAWSKVPNLPPRTGRFIRLPPASSSG